MKNNWPTVLITDETLRDGLQIEREGVTVDEKMELLGMMVDAGITRTVVGAFVNPKWSPQMADTLEVVGRLKPVKGVKFFALALNDRGREERNRHSPPLSVEPLPATHLHMCEVFLQRNTNRLLEEQEQSWRMPIKKAQAAGVKQAAIGLSAGWGSNWSGAFTRQARMEHLQRQYDAWNEAGIGVTRIDLADPMAWNTPAEVEEDLREIKQRFPTIKLFHLHLHNARGMALLSIYEALKVLDASDTLIADTTVGGIGGCPYCGNGQATGMIPTEEFVQLLETLGIETGIDLDKLIEASVRLSDILKRPLHSQVSRNGALPKGAKLYDQNVPAVYTFDEAQHFRLGPSVYEGNARPWVRPVTPTDK
jgi:hydroxymethylglutaryl-CoA lyase